MNKRIALLTAITLAVCLPGGRGLAQDQIVHTVAFPKGDVAWTVSFKLDDLPGHAPLSRPKTTERQMTKVDIVRKGNLRHDIVTWSNGSTTEYWWNAAPAFVLHQDGEAGHIFVMKTGNMDDTRLDETFFTWISPEYYIGLQDFEQKSCRYYEKTIALPNGDKALLRSWIENKTSIPVGWSQTGILSVFSFDTPLPPGPLVMPQNFQDALNHMESFFIFPKRSTSPGP